MSTESRPRWFFKPNYPVLGYFKICVVPSGHYMLTPLLLAQFKDRLAPSPSPPLSTALQLCCEDPQLLLCLEKSQIWKTQRLTQVG